MAKPENRKPTVFVFNPLAEGYIAHGSAFTPKKHQAQMAVDLANLPQFLCRADDVVVVPKRPAAEFVGALAQAGFALPEFVEFEAGAIPGSLRQRRIGRLRPWAWSPDSVALFEPLLGGMTPEERESAQRFTPQIAKLYSKAWSADLLRNLLAKRRLEAWNCPPEDVGVVVHSFGDAMQAIRAIRGRGHHRIVAKQAYGLAGQNSIRLWEPELLEAQRQWLQRAAAEENPLVIEPWLERKVDLSIQLEMGPGKLTVCGHTGLINDIKGQFQANWAAPDFALRFPEEVLSLFLDVPNFPDAASQLFEEIRVELEAMFNQAGYLGPAGIDAFVYRAASGAFRLKPIVEINPRYTMGRLTLELMGRVHAGSYGLLRLINSARARAEGFADLAEYGLAVTRNSPVRLEGELSPKINSGAVCLNEPARAQACLAIFEVGRTSFASDWNRL